jgi:hypothetical protein
MRIFAVAVEIQHFIKEIQFVKSRYNLWYSSFKLFIQHPIKTPLKGPKFAIAFEEERDGSSYKNFELTAVVDDISY